MKHVKLFEEYKETNFISAIESQLVPVPALGLYVTKNTIGPAQSLNGIYNFIKVLNKSSVNDPWRLPDVDELNFIYKNQDEFDMMTVYPPASNKRKLESHELWTNEVHEGGSHIYFSYGKFKSHVNILLLHDSIFVKEFNEAEKKKYAGAKTGRQYGI